MNRLSFLTLVFSFVLFISCNNDDDGHDRRAPITLGANVTVTNTLQSDAITNGVETTIEDLFGMDAGALAASSTVTDAVEFPAYLLGLYDINITKNSITFELVAAADDPTYSSFFRILEAGTTDRYYLTFDEAQYVSGFSSDNASVNLRIDSANILVVEIGEGFDFNPGTTFTITLN